jgi:regulatory protein
MAMARHVPSEEEPPRRERRLARPLDAARLQDLAVAYVARFATTGAKLERYLARKLRERGWEGEGEGEPDLAGLAARLSELGYIDDAAYASAKAGSLLRRGYGPRRVARVLTEAGVSEDMRQGLASEEGALRRAALALARRRGFGPFGAAPPDRVLREKQLAAMLRAGHTLDSAREMVDATTRQAAERWAAEPDEES